MSKRLTETEKWRDPWFRSLPPRHKLLWIWMLDSCDCAGVLREVDWGLVAFQVGEVMSEADLQSFDGRVEPIESGYWIPSFIAFQYRNFSVENPTAPMRGVLNALERVGIAKERLTEALGKAYQGATKPLKDKDKDIDNLVTPYSSEEFLAAWKKWRQHRSQIRKPLSALNAEMQLKALGGMGEADAIAAIEHSIASGYQGIFAPKNGQPKSAAHARSTFDLEAKAHGYTY